MKQEENEKKPEKSDESEVSKSGGLVPNIPLFRLHGDIKQLQRKDTFKQFTESPKGILFTTDVAARGLDLPQVNWVVQYDPPNEIKDYVHRVGRTARLGAQGEAILFLLQSEVIFFLFYSFFP